MRNLPVSSVPDLPAEVATLVRQGVYGMYAIEGHKCAYILITPTNPCCYGGGLPSGFITEATDDHTNTPLMWMLDINGAPIGTPCPMPDLSQSCLEVIRLV